MNREPLWWEKGIVYQIYPRSYQDSNGDGIGDLNGIYQRLDHIQKLNVDAVWLSPIYPSPMHDFGYDVADYVGINPMFGTMADFDQLLAAVHARGMKLIIDLVPNHSSDEHEWFIESRSSRNNPKRDWYIWRDPAPDGGPPNNWLSFFGGPAWTFDQQTGQYYLHQFVTQQPELNYRHPDVLPAMLDAMRFWLGKGVDGFRVDVIWLMMKDPEFRDEPINPDWKGGDPHGSLQHIYTQNLPEVHELIQKMRAVMDEYNERVMIGEIYLPFDELATYSGPEGARNECHLPFNFHLIYDAKWDAQDVQRLVEEYEASLAADMWPNWVLGNHDQHRIATRVGIDQARVANMLLLTLRGTPTTYYGEELGMENVPIPPRFVQDPAAVKQPEIAHIVGRDPERTPMQWDGSVHAGFSRETAVPWLPVADDYQTRNVAVQEQDESSMLHFYRALAGLRRAEPSLHVGAYQSVPSGHEHVYAYKRTAPDADAFLVLLNFSAQVAEVDVSGVGQTAVIAIATSMNRSGEVMLNAVKLNANEGLLLRL
ncbi:MAG: DUF3459 domain-containing protein [Chloroflexi bacterium]|nr:DUF3459 domain-containing protein [Chloroflexota bacterium]